MISLSLSLNALPLANAIGGVVNLLTNGTFDTDISGWTAAGGGTIEWDNGALKVNRVSGGTSGYQAVTLEVGQDYVFTYDVISGLSRSSVSLSAAVPATSQPSGTVFTATAETMYVHMGLNTGNGTSGVFDNISVVPA